MTLRQNLTIQEGATFSHTYTHTDSAGVAVDLTGYSARMSLRKAVGGSLWAYLTDGADADGGTITLGGASGTVVLAMTPSDTSALANAVWYDDLVIPHQQIPEAFIYDLELEAAGGTVTRAIEGKVTLSRSVTT